MIHLLYFAILEILIFGMEVYIHVQYMSIVLISLRDWGQTSLIVNVNVGIHNLSNIIILIEEL